MGTVALEFVPPNQEDGTAKAVEEAQKARENMEQMGIFERLNTLIIPGLIGEEEEERPVPFKPKIDPLETYQAVREILPYEGVVTQVTPFLTPEELDQRVQNLKNNDIERVIFVGVPRTMADGEGPGLSPVDALTRYQNELQGRGVILIPTRPDEKGRLEFKLSSGANFAMTQLLYSETIADFLPQVLETDYRPEVLLSFGHVAGAEKNVGLIQWLIKDNAEIVQQEMNFVAELGNMEFQERKKRLLDLYKRIIDRVTHLELKLGLHLEAPYGFSPQAMETFHDMLEIWSPE